MALSILLTTNSLGYGGIETYLVALAKALQQRRHRVVVVSEGGPLLAQLKADGIAHVEAPINWRAPWGLWRAAHQMRQAAHTYGADIIHSFSATASVVTHLALRGAGRPGPSPIPSPALISSPMGLQNSPNEPEIITRARNWLLTWGARKVLVISPQIKSHLRKIGLSEDKMVDFALVGIVLERYQADGTEAQAVRQEFGFAPDSPLVCTIGALDTRKSHQLFIAAAAQVAAVLPQARFLLVGGGEMEAELRARCRRMGLESKLVFTGARADIPRLLAATDVYVKPGVVEGYIGVTVLEALALARPVVAFETEDVKEAIRHGATGLLVPRGNTAALAQAIVALLKDPEHARQLGEEGQKLVREKFDFHKLVGRLEEIYFQVLG